MQNLIIQLTIYELQPLKSFVTFIWPLKVKRFKKIYVLTV